MPMSPLNSQASLSGSEGPAPTAVTAVMLRDWPLPQPDQEGDKDGRGSVLVVGGATQVPGAIILAGIAALRAGAGKLSMATCRSIAQAVAVAVPEALVAGLPEGLSGDIDPSAAQEIAGRANKVSAALIGPGMLDQDGATALLRALLPAIEATPLVLDAGALAGVSADPTLLHRLEGKVVLTPHAGEMASMLGISKEEVKRDPLATARHAAAQWRAVVALKGANTYIAAPDGATYCHTEGTVGLATSGSGDTLAGVIVGLLARGASPAQATAWGVYLHGQAGAALARRMGTLGFLAREVLAEIPPLMAHLAS